jgi:hypothetical protein
MWFYIGVSAIFSAWIDLFFIPPIFSTRYFYISTPVIVIMLAIKGHNVGFWFAFFNGLIMDIITESVPFGIFIFLNLILFLTAWILISSIFSGKDPFSISLISAITGFLSFILISLITYLVNFLNITRDYSFIESFNFLGIVIAPIASGLFTAILLFISKKIAFMYKLWFFTRR